MSKKDKPDWEANLSEPHLTNVVNELKTVEGRAYRKNWTQMQPGNTIRFNGKYDFLITEVTVYKDIPAMLVFEGLKNILPGVTSYKEGLDVYIKTVDNPSGLYTREDVKNGVVAIGLKKI
jgi:ASC-1-like (ASCH) protein